MDYEIVSPANERIKRLVRLRDRRERDREGLFPVEELRIVAMAESAGYHPAEVYWCPDLVAVPPANAINAVSVSPDALNKASYRSRPEGTIALFDYLPTDLGRLPSTGQPLLLVAEGLEKPGNLGALLRIADAAGVSGVVVVDEKVDPFNPNVVRASTGSLFTVPLAVSSLDEVSVWLTSACYRSVAALADGQLEVWEVDLTGPVAIWVGAEAPGLSDRAVRYAQVSAAIPMQGSVDSLNVAVAAGVMVYEAVRQRRAGQPE